MITDKEKLFFTLETISPLNQENELLLKKKQYGDLILFLFHYFNEETKLMSFFPTESRIVKHLNIAYAFHPEKWLEAFAYEMLKPNFHLIRLYMNNVNKIEIPDEHKGKLKEVSDYVKMDLIKRLQIKGDTPGKYLELIKMLSKTF